MTGCFAVEFLIAAVVDRHNALRAGHGARMPRDALYFCAGDQTGGSLTVLALTAGLSASRKAIRGWLDELLDVC